MSTETNPLANLSRAIEAHVSVNRGLVVAVRNAARQHLSGILWQANVIVTSEQAFGTREEYDVVNAAGQVAKARIAGRDPGTNVLVLLSDTPFEVLEPKVGSAVLGGLVVALAAQLDGATQVRLGAVQSIGEQWYSRAGGRIEQRIGLDIRVRRSEEGGPVFDANGGLVGMSTLGRPGEVLAIPAATIARVVPPLLQHGRVARGWLGVALQPIAVPDSLVETAGQSAGLMVMSTIDGAPAAQSGVRAGDILLSVDGAPLRDRRRLAAQLSEDSVGKTVQLRLIRGGEFTTLEVLVSTRS